jgi:hypothetical protein
VSVDADFKFGMLVSVFGFFAKGKIRGGLEYMTEEFGKVVNKAGYNEFYKDQHLRYRDFYYP